MQIKFSNLDLSISSYLRFFDKKFTLKCNNYTYFYVLSFWTLQLI